MSPFYLSKTVLLKHVSYTNVQQRHWNSIQTLLSQILLSISLITEILLKVALNTIIPPSVYQPQIRHKQQQYQSQSIKMLINNQTNKKCPPRYNWNIVESGKNQPSNKIFTLKHWRAFDSAWNVVAAGPTKDVNCDKFRR